MAEFCLECFNKLNDSHYKEKDVWLEDDYCEGCGMVKPCIVTLSPKPLSYKIRDAVRNLLNKNKDAEESYDE